MNVDVLGWYNHGNTGDEAYKASFPVLFPYHSLNFSDKLTHPNDSDVVILGGGDISYPSFTNQMQALPESTKKIALSISITPISRIDALKTFNKVYLRDYQSLAIAHEHNLNAVYLPDATFALTGNPNSGREWLDERFRRQKHTLYEKVVVCVVNSYLLKSGLDDLCRDMTTFMYFSQHLSKLADSTNASFVFLPFSTMEPWDDRVSNAWTANRCKYYNKNMVIYDVPDVQTTLDIIACADLCISSRLHSTIFSTIAGTPFVDITHHSKNHGFIQSVGKENWSVPYWDFSPKELSELTQNLIIQPDKDESLTNFTKIAKEQLYASAIL